MLVIKIHFQIKKSKSSLIGGNPTSISSVFYNSRVSLTPGSKIGKEELSDFCLPLWEILVFQLMSENSHTACLLPTSLPLMMPHTCLLHQRTAHSYRLFYQCPLLIRYYCRVSWASMVAQLVKNLPAVQENPVQFLGQEDLMEKG